MKTKIKSKHRPTPWNRQSYRIWHGPISVADCSPDNGVGPLKVISQQECVANADFIVRAVNSYDVLLEAVKIAYRHFDHITERFGPGIEGELALKMAEAIDQAEWKS